MSRIATTLWRPPTSGRRLSGDCDGASRHSRPRAGCSTDAYPRQLATWDPARHCDLAILTIFLTISIPRPPNCPCLRAMVRSDSRNRNPRVGGSGPSSGTLELPSKRLDRDPRKRTTGSAWGHRWGHPPRGSHLAAFVLAGMARAHTRARDMTGPPHVGVAVPLGVVGRDPLRFRHTKTDGTAAYPLQSRGRAL